MKVLLVGGGGREHALAWALSRSPLVDQLLTAPGNPGTAAVSERHSVSVDDLEGMVELAKDEEVDLVVVGPEAPLVGGLADVLIKEGIRVFGPRAKAAQLEGSKAFAKRLMAAKGIPTAASREFDSARDAVDYVRDRGAPLVVKADGIAAGKGVTVCDSIQQAEEAIRAALTERRFGDSGSRILIEERLEGNELSVLAFCDGTNVLTMEAARDFKRALDGDRGPNTGGMGSYSPVTECDPALLDRVTDDIIQPIAHALKAEAGPYVGVIYAGLMFTSDGPKVIEFNCRFGDPEAQALIPRLDSDLAEPILACVEGNVADTKLSWKQETCVTVVLTSDGYPGSYQTGYVIEGIEEAERLTGIPVFHSGTKFGPSKEVLSDGGRVLSVSALGDDQREAAARAYEAAEQISFAGKTMRTDIAKTK